MVIGSIQPQAGGSVHTPRHKQKQFGVELRRFKGPYNRTAHFCFDQIILRSGGFDRAQSD
jgi:hypothetical protein